MRSLASQLSYVSHAEQQQYALLSVLEFLCVCVCVCACVRVCVRACGVCVCARVCIDWAQSSRANAYFPVTVPI